MGKDAPPAPDYTGAAVAQGQQTQQLAAQQTAANRPNVNTPWGSISWQNNPTAGTPAVPPKYDKSGALMPGTGTEATPGMPNWTGNVTLTPQEQASLTSQQNIQEGKSGIAESLLNSTGQALSTGNPRATGSVQSVSNDPQMLNQQTTNAVWDQFKGMELPLQQQQMEQERSQLQGQGLREGDAAYDTSVKNLMNTQFTQQQQAADQALLAGEQEGSTLNQEKLANTGFNNQAIGQDLGLQQQQQTYPLNLLNASLNGTQVQNPQFPGYAGASSGQAPDLLAAAQNQGNALLNTYNADVSQGNAVTGAAGTALAGYLAYLAAA